MSSVCTSCELPIMWAVTPAGAKAPIEREPNKEKGNVLVLQPRALGSNLLAVTLTGDALELARRSGQPLWLNHYASCPDRERWREQTDAKRKAGVDGQ